MKLPVFDREFQVETDACDYGCGGVLTQQHEGNWHPVAYFSKSLTVREQKYATAEKELYAVVLSCEHFRQFLYGTSFKVLCDHKPLQYLLANKNPAERLARWTIRLNMFDCTIEYRKGSQNQCADAMSRLCEESDDNTASEYGLVVINSTLTQMQAQSMRELGKIAEKEHQKMSVDMRIQQDELFGQDNKQRQDETTVTNFILYSSDEHVRGCFYYLNKLVSLLLKIGFHMEKTTSDKFFLFYFVLLIKQY